MELPPIPLGLELKPEPRTVDKRFISRNCYGRFGCSAPIDKLQALRLRRQYRESGGSVSFLSHRHPTANLGESALPVVDTRCWRWRKGPLRLEADQDQHSPSHTSNTRP